MKPSAMLSHIPYMRYTLQFGIILAALCSMNAANVSASANATPYPIPGNVKASPASTYLPVSRKPLPPHGVSVSAFEKGDVHYSNRDTLRKRPLKHTVRPVQRNIPPTVPAAAIPTPVPPATETIAPLATSSVRVRPHGVIPLNIPLNVQPIQMPESTLQITQPIPAKSVQPVEEAIIVPGANDLLDIAPAIHLDHNKVSTYKASNTPFGEAPQVFVPPAPFVAANAMSAPPIPAEPVTPPSPISAKTKAILNTLPADIFPTPRHPQGGFEVDRNVPFEGLPTGEGVDMSESIGANIAIRRQDVDVNYELEKAYNALLRGNTEIAIRIYHDILQAEPSNKHALFGLATTYHKLGMTEKARPVYGRLLEQDPYNTEALNNFLALVGEEAPESAIVYLEDLKMNNRDFSPVYAQLARLYTQQGNHPQAVANMQEAVAMSPENLIYLYNLAVLYDKQGKVNRASVIYRQLIRAGLDGKDIPATLSDLQKRLTFLQTHS